MKKFLFIILTVFLLMPVTNAFANPDAAGNTNYLYLLPQEDGTVQFVSKFIGVKEAGITFEVPTNATNVKTVVGCELKDGKIVSTIPNETGKVEYHYNLALQNGEFNYITPLANTALTVMTPVEKGLLLSNEVELESETSGAGDFNMDGLNDYFFAGLIADANKPVKMVYDQSAKVPGNKTTETPKTDQKSTQENDTKVTPAENSNTTLFIVLGTLGVVVIAGVGLYFYFRSQKGNSKTSDSSDGENEDEFVKLAQQRKDILGKISELQENLEAGVITAEEHSEKEKVLREKLLKVTVNIKNFTE